ncbi:MAG: lipase family alpha/beta hydrolase, partial [Thermoleophilaceae bacterium]
VAARRAADAPSLAATPRGGALIGALNGAFGDTLHARHRALSSAMAVRSAGGDVPLRRGALTAAFPAAGPHVVVLVHGLGETERSWHRREHAHGRALPASYGTLLERDLGLTAVTLRFNSGRHIFESGEELAALLGDLVGAWPVPVASLALVGHSMGGMVIRSALHHSQLGEADWLRHVADVVGLGSPFLGAPLERATNRATWALGKLPETAPLARVINLRAAGVKDLRYGALVREDWGQTDPDALGRDTARDVHHLASAQHYCVSSNLGATQDHLLGRLLGDVLVPLSSANGSGASARRTPLAFDDAAHFPGLTHFDLLNHPAVYARLREWLAPPRRGRGAGRPGCGARP